MDHHRKAWHDFLELCLATKDTKLLSDLFDLLLTIEEKDSIAMRTMIVRDLVKKKKTQREIAKDLQVSIAKITRGSNALKRMHSKVVHFLETYFKPRGG